MGLGKRLRRLDDSSGVGDWASSRLEFWAHVYVTGCLLLVAGIVFAAVLRDWALAAFFAFVLILVGARAYVGVTLRRRRNRSEDKWRDPW